MTLHKNPLVVLLFYDGKDPIETGHKNLEIKSKLFLRLPPEIEFLFQDGFEERKIRIFFAACCNDDLTRLSSACNPVNRIEFC